MKPQDLSLFASRFEAVTRSMASTLLRTGRSGVLNRARDLSCCIVTADCALVAAANSLPIHVLSGPDMMARAMLEFHPALRRGDAYLHNSPYHGCSHAADLTLLVPVIDDAGRHRYTVLVKAHQADIGNAVPTTYHATARDVYEEGALIFPAVQVERDYRPIADIVRMCQLRIRVPDQWHGDLLAMIGSARVGEAELMALGREAGWDTLDQFVERWFDYSEQRMCDAIAALPAGIGQGASRHDAMPGLPQEGLEIRAKVEVMPAQERIVIDLRDNADCLPCGLNLSEACARTAALIGIFTSVAKDVPKNAGSFRRVEVLLRENCVVGIPRHPTSTSVATTNLADRACAAVQLALADIADGLGMAETGAINPPAKGVISGTDPRTGRRFINQLFLGSTCGGASPAADGWLTHSHAGNGGMCFVDSIEMAELCHPILVDERRLEPDTEGAGIWCGAPSMRISFRSVGTALTVAYVSDGTFNPPRGVRGGADGAPAAQRLRRGEHESDLPNVGQVEIDPADTIVSWSTAGGGYGSPRRRDPQRVARDVLAGRVSRERASAVYGVVVDEHGGLDVRATRKLRQEDQ